MIDHIALFYFTFLKIAVSVVYFLCQSFSPHYLISHFHVQIYNNSLATLLNRT